MKALEERVIELEQTLASSAALISTLEQAVAEIGKIVSLLEGARVLAVAETDVQEPPPSSL